MSCSFVPLLTDISAHIITEPPTCVMVGWRQFFLKRLPSQNYSSLPYSLICPVDMLFGKEEVFWYFEDVKVGSSSIQPTVFNDLRIPEVRVYSVNVGLHEVSRGGDFVFLPSRWSRLVAPQILHDLPDRVPRNGGRRTRRWICFHLFLPLVWHFMCNKSKKYI